MCAWCGRKIAGILPESHGICRSCMERILAEFRKSEDNRKK
jgi:DNA-directed RNA polymerase subunit RPC12/RpoP